MGESSTSLDYSLLVEHSTHNIISVSILISVYSVINHVCATLESWSRACIIVEAIAGLESTHDSLFIDSGESVISVLARALLVLPMQNVSKSIISDVTDEKL